ncbi:MAG: acetate--CoA ligase [Saprospiraceae bacterium]|nr:acetate--CoA ligase [Saprospiraceae bacterium]MBK7811279.1 acetate--CoA ligase [Saprospiraceae bacterium]MBK9631019.1 acetate--CoA ligase [Saprospiraceae bacterium]
MFESYQIHSRDQYEKDYKNSLEDPEKFWGNIAEHFVWQKKWDQVLDWEFKTPSVKWFDGGLLNVSENCIDRFVKIDPSRIALIWEANDPSELPREISYLELQNEVCKYANMLQSRGVKKSNRVIIYMGMVPELVFAVLACARLGAIHSVIFAGFSAISIKDRIVDCEATHIITCDGTFRGAKCIDLKSIIDEAIFDLSFIKNVFVLQRTRQEVKMVEGRDVWIHELIDQQSDWFEPVAMSSEDPLFILYTSGSTGKPKGVVHSTAGYMIWANYTFINVFQYKTGQIHFCTADIGWITGHSYIIYGPLSAGAATLMFEGIPTWPNEERLWQIIDKHQVNILYTAPTAIRSLMVYGEDPPSHYSLESLKVLGTVGEPINEEAWHWYDQNIGKSRIPIVDTWWQTETGGIMISNLAGITESKPTYATLPLPGVSAVLKDQEGKNVMEAHQQSALFINKPWPGIIRTTYQDHARCKLNYFSQIENMYCTGDGAFVDEENNFRIIGRIDDVLNVSGHRLGTAELENAINEHPSVIESAVVGYPHDLKGQGIYAFIICQDTTTDHDLMTEEIRELVQAIIGPIAKPDKIQMVTGLPKTRSGKIMRRILRKIAEGEKSNFGDLTSLIDANVIDQILANAK